jgi:ribosomal protein S27AE
MPMPKTGEEKPCPKCGGTMTWMTERGADPNAAAGSGSETVPLRKLWTCGHCGYEDEFSYRMTEA